MLTFVGVVKDFENTGIVIVKFVVISHVYQAALEGVDEDFICLVGVDVYKSFIPKILLLLHVIIIINLQQSRILTQLLHQLLTLNPTIQENVHNLHCQSRQRRILLLPIIQAILIRNIRR